MENARIDWFPNDREELLRRGNYVETRRVKEDKPFLKKLKSEREKQFNKIKVEEPVNMLKSRMLRDSWSTMAEAYTECNYKQNRDLSTMARKIKKHFKDEGLFVQDVRIRNIHNSEINKVGCQTHFQIFYDTK